VSDEEIPRAYAPIPNCGPTAFQARFARRNSCAPSRIRGFTALSWSSGKRCPTGPWRASNSGPLHSPPQREGGLLPRAPSGGGLQGTVEIGHGRRSPRASPGNADGGVRENLPTLRVRSLSDDLIFIDPRVEVPPRRPPLSIAAGRTPASSRDEGDGVPRYDRQRREAAASLLRRL